jgi:hypothetical protein
MKLQTLTQDLAERIPGIADNIDEERQLWEPESPGQDIILGDVLVPYVVDVLRNPRGHEGELRSIFGLVEELAAHSDERLEWLAMVSVLEALEDHPDLLKRAASWLGPATRSKLPTREWVQAHAPSSY